MGPFWQSLELKRVVTPPLMQAGLVVPPEQAASGVQDVHHCWQAVVLSSEGTMDQLCLVQPPRLHAVPLVMARCFVSAAREGARAVGLS